MNEEETIVLGKMFKFHDNVYIVKKFDGRGKEIGKATFHKNIPFCKENSDWGWKSGLIDAIRDAMTRGEYLHNAIKAVKECNPTPAFYENEEEMEIN